MNRSRWLLLGLLVGAFGCAYWFASSSLRGPLYRLPTERFGVCVAPQVGPITDYDVRSLHLGWYCDWQTSLSPARPDGIEYAQLISVVRGVSSVSPAELASLVDANRGSLWIVGNEPECVWQDNCTPQQYATVYQDLYTRIKQRDPTARVAIGGVVQPTPLRLQWLDQVLDLYRAAFGVPMPVDVWNIHNHLVQELQGSWGCEIPTGLTATSGRLYTIEDNDNLQLFQQQIVEFRTWMRDRGQRDKPLIISEYGVSLPAEYGFTPQRVNAFMNASFDYLLTARDDNLGYPADENRLVQRWLWFSLNDPPWDAASGKGFNGALFDYRYRGDAAALTPAGMNWRAYADGLLARSTTASP